MLSSDCKLQKDVAQSYVILANSKKPLATLAREKNSVLSSTFSPLLNTRNLSVSYKLIIIFMRQQKAPEFLTL